MTVDLGDASGVETCQANWRGSMSRISRDWPGRETGSRVGELSGRMPSWLLETAAEGHGYLDDVAETALIEQLGPGHGALHKEAVAARMAIMGDERPRLDRHLLKPSWPNARHSAGSMSS